MAEKITYRRVPVTVKLLRELAADKDVPIKEKLRILELLVMCDPAVTFNAALKSDALSGMADKLCEDKEIQGLVDRLLPRAKPVQR